MVMPAQNPKTGLPEDVEWVVRAETTPTFFLLKQHYCLLQALMVFRTLPASKKKSGTFVKHVYADSTDFKWLGKPFSNLVLLYRIWKMMMQQFEFQRCLPLTLSTTTLRINQHKKGVCPRQRGDLKGRKEERRSQTHTHTRTAQIWSLRECLMPAHLQCLAVPGELETLGCVLRAGTGGWFSFTSFDSTLTVLQIQRHYSQRQQREMERKTNVI